MDELARHRWIATRILPLESQVRRWLYRHVRSLSADDIDDLIQEAYSRIWRAEFDSIHNARSYFYRTLRNLLLEQARHAQIVPMERMGEIDALRIPSNEPSPERRASARQEFERLRAVVIALPAQCRRAFELRKMLGFSQREAANEMGVSERTVEKHVAKALDRLLAAVAGIDAREEAREDTWKIRNHGTQAERD